MKKSSSRLSRFLHIFTAQGSAESVGATKRADLRVMRRMIGRITRIMRRKMIVEGVFGLGFEQLSGVFLDA